jgi:hypothetical protein
MFQQVTRCDWGGERAHRGDAVAFNVGLLWGFFTFDLYRVNFEVNNLKPFACLAFLHIAYFKTRGKQPIFGDELVTSFADRR